MIQVEPVTLEFNGVRLSMACAWPRPTASCGTCA
jgi:hypothetical protein